MEQGLDLFGKLTERASVFLVALGVFLFLGWALNGSKIGTLDLSMDSAERWLILIVALILVIVGLWRFISENGSTTEQTAQLSADSLDTSKRQQHHRIIKLKKDKELLGEKILRIQELVSSNHDEVSLEIRQILSDVDAAFSDFNQSLEDEQLIAKWIDHRIRDWVASLSKRDYPRVKKVRNGDFYQFKEEVKELLILLKNNILEGVNNSPKELRLIRHINYPFLYRKALFSIQDSIYEELNETKDLNSRQQDALMDYMNQLIDYID